MTLNRFIFGYWGCYWHSKYKKLLKEHKLAVKKLGKIKRGGGIK